MIHRTGIVLIFICLLLMSVFANAKSQTGSQLIGKKTKVSFDKALPEDISNDNFPDIVESFDYPNADILDLVKAIGKLTGLNFIVDPSLAGKTISVIAPSKITVAEAYKAFLSALSINGYTLVKAGAFWKVQTTEKAQKDNIEVYAGEYYPNTDQLITRIIKLKNINAEEFKNSIKFLLSQNAVSHYADSNSVIISDYGSVIERVMKIAKALDIPGSRENVKIIPIQYASASSLADMINDLLSSNSPVSRARRTRKNVFRNNTDNSGSIKISQVLADERTNSIIISANNEGLKKVEDLIKKLDTYVDPSRTGGIYVYNVLYGTAEDVYNTLMGIRPSTNSSSFNRRSINSTSRRSSSRPLSKTNSSASPLFGDNVTLMADMNTNSLIISAKNTYDFERVKQVLKKIDVPRDQVFVQAVIVEMSTNTGDTWEVNLAHSIGAGLKKILGDKLAPTSAVNNVIGGFLNRSLSADPSSIIKNSQLGPGLVFALPFTKILEGMGLTTSVEDENKKFTDDIKASGLSLAQQNIAITEHYRRPVNTTQQALNLSAFPLLKILKQAGNVNVLSTPQITALDNITASIEVGENAPVGIKSTSTGFSSFAQNSVEREDVTLKLEITPRINPDSGTVQMKIHQKFDDFSSRVSTASDLQDKGVHIIKRNIETQMVLNDGETAVLGGLLTDKVVQNERKIPILGDIPLIGWLFKGSDVITEKRNLVVFITPRIIRGEKQKEQMQQLLGEKTKERTDFVNRHLKGRDPYRKIMSKIKNNSSFQNNSSGENQDSKATDLLQEDNASDVPEDVLPSRRFKKSRQTPFFSNPSNNNQNQLELEQIPLEENYSEEEAVEATEVEEVEEYSEESEATEEESAEENPAENYSEESEEAEEYSEESEDYTEESEAAKYTEEDISEDTDNNQEGIKDLDSDSDSENSDTREAPAFENTENISN